ncbi:MAG TPA: molybdopterin-dependent oxidoreductase [Acidimicrobiales bacterium]|nr:molybdopterin-dependent oxidoreductase [Acidimicrobiales bacterium]
MTEVATYCPLCVSRCGARATVANGTFTLGRDPSHPTGKALCAKGKAAPEITAHPDRLRYPMKRTAAKDAPAPSWQRISWEEALETVAGRLRALARDHGPESVVFSSVSPSTSSIVDCVDWLQRLQRAFGSPNLVASMELCGWGRYLASLYTYGASVPGEYMPDLEGAGCILFWGYNPLVSRLAHATATRAALRRGAKLVVVDPRRAGLATKADPWLRVRPGTDAALALAITHVMIERGWYDDAFVRRWTNAPLLVRTDTGRLLRASDVVPGGDPGHHVVWDVAGQPVVVDPAARGSDVDDHGRLALTGTVEVPTTGGVVACRPAFDLLAEQCRATSPAVAEEITGVPAAEIERTAQVLWEHRPVAFYTWSGLEQHSGTTQIIRAVNVLYALTGCFDAPGGNVLFTPVPTNPVAGSELLDPSQRAKAIGVDDRPLGPARFEFVTGEDFYTAALEGRPYRARGLVSFGSNLVMAHGDSARGRDALRALDFHVHLDMFMSPTAEQADIVLPVTGAFEAENLKVGFEVSQDAESLVQLRAPLVPPVGEARPDIEVIFDLATRLGLGEHFFDGDVEAGWAHHLEPSGVTLRQLRDDPAGVVLPLATRHRKYAVAGDDGVPAGFRTATGLIELYVEGFLDVGQPPVPTYTEPCLSPRSRPDLAGRFPLVLTCAKPLHFCETQHRQVAGLRRHAPHPEVELHPSTATGRGIAEGDWVEIATPKGSVRAVATFDDSLAPDVVCAQHGWSEPCEELGLPGHPPFGPGSANLNLVLTQTPSDPISGSSPLRAQVCEVTRLPGDQALPTLDRPASGHARPVTAGGARRR